MKLSKKQLHRIISEAVGDTIDRSDPIIAGDMAVANESAHEFSDECVKVLKAFLKKKKVRATQDIIEAFEELIAQFYYDEFSIEGTRSFSERSDQPLDDL